MINSICMSTSARLLHPAFTVYVDYVNFAVWSHNTSDNGLCRHWYFLGSTTAIPRSLDCLWRTCVLLIMWHQSSVHCTGFRSVSAYNTNCVLMYFVAHDYAPDYISNLATLTSATSGRSHLRSADSLTFDIPWTRTRMRDRALSVAGPWKKCTCAFFK